MEHHTLEKEARQSQTTLAPSTLRLYLPSTSVEAEADIERMDSAVIPPESPLYKRSITLKDQVKSKANEVQRLQAKIDTLH